MEWIKVKHIRLQYMGRSTSDIKGSHLTSMHLHLSTREDVKQVEHKMGTSEPSTLICYICQGCLWIINCCTRYEHFLKKLASLEAMLV